MSGKSKRKRRFLLLASFVAPAALAAVILGLVPGFWFLLAAPLALWGGLFFAWAWLALKDPGYYDQAP